MAVASTTVLDDMEETTIELHTAFPRRHADRIDNPLTSGQVFREWGIIVEMRADFIPDPALPATSCPKSTIDIGTIFLLVRARRGPVTAARGIVVGENNRSSIPQRLITRSWSYERRDFYPITGIGTSPMASRSASARPAGRIRERWQETRCPIWQWSELNEAVPVDEAAYARIARPTSIFPAMTCG